MSDHFITYEELCIKFLRNLIGPKKFYRHLNNRKFQFSINNSKLQNIPIIKSCKENANLNN
ncbi:hypothetical protein FWK35_00020592 [Aphis craccivora]|uniref:Uncharacterized protein n=1 Tax=Aphis craccivora TaxID=307492 RepID=A0A6G0X4N3_APHCR|nr:hypothetical protein FWK35_00020592 [Aphis craccivora]